MHVRNERGKQMPQGLYYVRAHTVISYWNESTFPDKTTLCTLYSVRSKEVYFREEEKLCCPPGIKFVKREMYWGGFLKEIDLELSTTYAPVRHELTI